MSKLHEALRIVEATERLWERDDARASMRAALVVSRLIQEGHLQGTVRGLQPLAPEPRPTVEELDAILNSEEATNVEVQPDGSVMATLKITDPEVITTLKSGSDPLFSPTFHVHEPRMEDGMTNGALPWAHFTVTDPKSGVTFKNVARDLYKPETTEHLPRLQLEMNNTEWMAQRAEYRGMYDRTADELKWALRAEYIAQWGQIP